MRLTGVFRGRGSGRGKGQGERVVLGRASADDEGANVGGDGAVVDVEEEGVSTQNWNGPEIGADGARDAWGSNQTRVRGG